jgi:hypothetical protein
VQAAPAAQPTAAPVQPIADQYAAQGVAAGQAVSARPSFQESMPFYDAWGRLAPQATLAAESQVNPEMMRQYKAQSGDYMRALYLDGGSYNQFRFIYVQPERFFYCGNSFELPNVVYATLGQDYKLYIKSANPAHKIMENMRIWGVFENPETAWIASVDYDVTIDFDKNIYYPIDADMWVMIKEVILKQLITSLQIPEDKVNNADEQ